MAINKQVFKKVGTNAAAITKGSSWVGMLRVRMTDSEMAQYGACNTFRFLNKSALKIRVRFGWNNEGGAPYYDIEGNGIMNLTIDDGLLSYGFDVMNLDAGTDVAIGEFTYNMSRVEQIPERLV